MNSSSIRPSPYRLPSSAVLMPMNRATLRWTKKSGLSKVFPWLRPFTTAAARSSSRSKTSLAHGSLDPRMVKIPGIYVDCVVVAAPEDHQQTYDCQYDPSLSGEHRAPEGAADEALPMSAKKIIGRRGGPGTDRKRRRQPRRRRSGIRCLRCR